MGRDHTGVGNYYSSNASQEIFKRVGDIGIKPIFFDTVYYCSECGSVTDGCSHKKTNKSKVSATEIRKYIKNNEKPPEYLLRKEVSELLNKMMKNNEKIFVS